MTFEFAAPGRILFGEGRVREAGAIASGLGTKALLVHGGAWRGDPLERSLREQGVTTLPFRVPTEPTARMITAGVEESRAGGCDLVIAMGGGSVIDAAKAIAALLTNPGELREYLEVVGEGRSLTERSAPLLALPTTAGTGAEVTRNAVILAEEEGVKVSMRSPLMIPTIALIDPELTYTLPPDVTASTGLDALTQCIEPFVSPHGNPLTDAAAGEGIRLAGRSLERAYHDGSDAGARRDMAVASLCGGLSLANAKLGAVHGFAAPIGGSFPVPHGTVCGTLLPHVVAANIRALRSRDPRSPALARYHEVAVMLTGRAGAQAEDAAVWIGELVAKLGLSSLAPFGLAEADIPGIVARARLASSMQGNPVILEDEELASILRAAL